MSNGDWRNDPILGQGIRRVVESQPHEARIAAENIEKFDKFLKENNEDQVSKALKKHSSSWAQIKRYILS
jgi:hypothetical protein